MAQIKAIDPEGPEEDREEERDEPIFALSRRCGSALALSFSPIHSVLTHMVIVCTPGPERPARTLFGRDALQAKLGLST